MKKKSINILLPLRHSLSGNRIINNLLGISRKDDTLSPRLLVHDRKEGGAAGSLPHLGKMLSEYYTLRGWSPEGTPLPETLDRLGL